MKVVSVDFREYVNPPGSRETVQRITQNEKISLVRDAVGVTAKVEDQESLYPWSVIKQANNVSVKR